LDAALAIFQVLIGCSGRPSSWIERLLGSHFDRQTPTRRG